MAGSGEGREDKRRQLIREAIVGGVDYVDLEVDVAPEIRRYGKTKRIISYHNTQQTPEELDEIVYRCEETRPGHRQNRDPGQDAGQGFEVLKYATTSNFP